MKKLLALLFIVAHLTMQAQPLRLTQPTVNEFSTTILNEYKNGKTGLKELLANVLIRRVPSSSVKRSLEQMAGNRYIFDHVVYLVHQHCNFNKKTTARYLTYLKLTPSTIKSLTEYSLYAFAKVNDQLMWSGGEKPLFFEGTKKFRDDSNTWYYIFTIDDDGFVLKIYPSLKNPAYTDKKTALESIHGKIEDEKMIFDDPRMQNMYRFKNGVLLELNGKTGINEYFECTPEDIFVHGKPRHAYRELKMDDVLKQEARTETAEKNQWEPEPAPQEPKEEVFTFVEQPPTFPGGDEKLTVYLRYTTKYPEEANKENITGTIFVSFVIDSLGYIKDIKTVGQRKGGGLEEEAMRVVREMPRWKPGKQNGRPCSVQFNLPIKFSLLPEEK